MLNRVKSSGLQPNTIAPAARIMMAIKVLNGFKDSTDDAPVTLLALDSSVAKSLLSCEPSDGNGGA
jgi:hypothetical protein